MPCQARDWHSADGKRTLTASFQRLVGDQLWLRSPAGKDSAISLRLLSADDIAFAQAAQRVAEVAIKAGPLPYELTQVLADDGLWLCRLGRTLASQQGAIVYTGDFFVLRPPANVEPRLGSRFKPVMLYPATQREFHPVNGQPLSITEYCLDLEQAAALNVAWGITPVAAVYEPIIEQVASVGAGYVVGRGGFVLVDTNLAADAASLTLRVGKVDAPASILATDDALGLTLLVCKPAADIEPLRLAGRARELELGQRIYALSLSNGDDRKSFTEPAITQGIISRLSGANGEVSLFQHDAALPEQRLGSMLISDKGELLGLVAGLKVKSGNKGKASAMAKANVAAEAALADSALHSSLRVEAVLAFLQTRPELPALRSGSSGSSDLTKAIESLRQSLLLVTATREVRREQHRPVAASPNNPAAAGAGAAAGHSLSKTGVRHNAKCRYFNAKLPCQPGDGRACQICGG